MLDYILNFFFFFQAEVGILYFHVTGVQTCALPILKVSKVYAINCPRRSSQRRRLWQQLNPRRVVLRYNTCRAENLVTHPRRVVRANRSESIARSSEVHSTLVEDQREVLVTPEVRDYATPVVCLTLVVVNRPLKLVSVVT